MFKYIHVDIDTLSVGLVDTSFPNETFIFPQRPSVNIVEIVDFCINFYKSENMNVAFNLLLCKYWKSEFEYDPYEEDIIHYYTEYKEEIEKFMILI